MRQYVARPGQECKSELIVGTGLERVRCTVWYYQFWWLVQWNPGMHQRTNGAWDAFWKQAMSRQREYGWAAYSRPGMQWMKKILKWSLMFSSMVHHTLCPFQTSQVISLQCPRFSSIYQDTLDTSTIDPSFDTIRCTTHSQNRRKLLELSPSTSHSSSSRFHYTPTRT